MAAEIVRRPVEDLILEEDRQAQDGGRQAADRARTDARRGRGRGGCEIMERMAQKKAAELTVYEVSP
jgi:hypothetical protein